MDVSHTIITKNQSRETAGCAGLSEIVTVKDF